MITANLHQILPGVFISDSDCASNKHLLKGIKITHILICAAELQERFPSDFNYLKLQIVDLASFRIDTYFNTSNKFIQNALRSGGYVLIHCNLGKSRSATISAALLISKLNYTATEALEHVKSVHPDASPNKGFIKCLKRFEKEQKELRKGQACECRII